jgi:3-isopropylmalate/(R)-2-methylmalate dehydratase large subunit
MAIEAGARVGMVAVDDTTITYLEGRPLAPRGEEWVRCVAYWRTSSDVPSGQSTYSAIFSGEISTRS